MEILVARKYFKLLISQEFPVGLSVPCSVDLANIVISQVKCKRQVASMSPFEIVHVIEALVSVSSGISSELTNSREKVCFPVSIHLIIHFLGVSVSFDCRFDFTKSDAIA
jgi:hypothetical protein